MECFENVAILSNLLNFIQYKNSKTVIEFIGKILRFSLLRKGTESDILSASTKKKKETYDTSYRTNKGPYTNYVDRILAIIDPLYLDKN